jgi:tRNA modification GTPase
MYNLNETIVAVSSPSLGARSIIRLTGPNAICLAKGLFNFSRLPNKSGIRTGGVAIGPELHVDATLYLFLAPHSYTGEDTAEIHIDASQAAVEGLMEALLTNGKTPLRLAGPGEFTARAYLNGKLNLAQAEAVNEIITCSNRLQLAAAERLLAGRLTETTEEILTAIMNCLSLLEAGLDFSTEDIEFITRDQAIQKLERIKQMFEQLLAESTRYESVVDLPAVGIAGAPGAGKSSLLNKLLAKPRSIVSGRRKTTRDVLTDVLILTNCRCVIFDCAGLLEEPDNILDELAHRAAIEALRNATVVIFCVDIAKSDWREDLAVWKLLRCHCERSEAISVVAAATKSDLLSEDALNERLMELNKSFAADFLPTSAKTGEGIKQLREAIDKKIIELALGDDKRGTRGEARETSLIALTARHRQAVAEAIKNISESIEEVKIGNDEVAAMLLRSAYQAASNIQQQHIDEQILEEIFSHFCIGK